MKPKRLLFPVLAMTALLVVALVEPAFAARSAGQAINHLGDLLKRGAAAVFTGVCAWRATAHILSREHQAGVVFGVMAVFLGLFVFAPDAVVDFVKGASRDIFG